MQKLWKRKGGSTKIVLTKREEFFQKKHRKAINELLEPESEYFFQKYLHPENDFLPYARRRTTIAIDPRRLMMRAGPELSEEEHKLMLLLGIPPSKIEERLRKHIKKSET